MLGGGKETNTFIESIQPERTIDTSFFSDQFGLNISLKNLHVHNNLIKFHIYRISMEKRYEEYNRYHLKGALGYLLLFELGNKEQYQKVISFIDLIKKENNNARIVIIGQGTKNLKHREVSTIEALSYATKNNYLYFENFLLKPLEIMYILSSIILEKDIPESLRKKIIQSYQKTPLQLAIKYSWGEKLNETELEIIRKYGGFLERNILEKKLENTNKILSHLNNKLQVRLKSGLNIIL